MCYTRCRSLTHARNRARAHAHTHTHTHTHDTHTTHTHTQRHTHNTHTPRTPHTHIHAHTYTYMQTKVPETYTLQVILLEYKHLDLKLWDGNCCSANCSHSCNSTFRFCLQEEECTLGDGCPCTHDVISTDHFPLNVSSVVLAVGENLVDSVSNPLVFNVMQWKVSCLAHNSRSLLLTFTLIT